MQSGGAERDADESGERLKETGRERRKNPRYETQTDSIALALDNKTEVHGRIENLSVSGCRVEVEDLCPAVAGAQIEIAFKISREALRLSGIVQWFDGRQQIGIRFEAMSDGEKLALNEVMAALAAAKALRADQESAGVEGAPQKRKEEKAMEPALAGQGAERNRERRHHPRQKMHSVAAIYPIEHGGKLNAWILNLSLGGCRLRLETDALIDVQVRVEVGFFFEGMPFRVGGMVQGNYAKQEVGIKFVDVSERNRKRLEDLIAELQDRDREAKDN